MTTETLPAQDKQHVKPAGMMRIESKLDKRVRVPAKPPWARRFIEPGRDNVFHRNVIASARADDAAFDKLWDAGKLRDVGDYVSVAEDIRERTST